jgi:hypothetical protein
MKSLVRMTRKKETKSFIIFECKATREVIYVSKESAGDELLAAERINLTIEVTS